MLIARRRLLPTEGVEEPYWTNEPAGTFVRTDHGRKRSFGNRASISALYACINGDVVAAPDASMGEATSVPRNLPARRCATAGT